MKMYTPPQAKIFRFWQGQKTRQTRITSGFREISFQNLQKILQICKKNADLQDFCKIPQNADLGRWGAPVMTADDRIYDWEGIKRFSQRIGGPNNRFRKVPPNEFIIAQSI